MRYIVKQQVHMGGAPLYQVWDTALGSRVGSPVYCQGDAEQTRDRLNHEAQILKANLDTEDGKAACR